MGNLSQYFCEKNSLEEELSIAQEANNSTLVNSLEDEIEMATRNAYLYAAGVTAITFVIAVLHAWVFYLASATGMRNRILLTAVIYEKVTILCLYMYLRIYTFKKMELISLSLQYLGQ